MKWQPTCRAVASGYEEVRCPNMPLTHGLRGKRKAAQFPAQLSYGELNSEIALTAAAKARRRGGFGDGRWGHWEILSLKKILSVEKGTLALRTSEKLEDETSVSGTSTQSPRFVELWTV